MKTNTISKVCLFGGALLAAGLSSGAQGGEFIIGASSHNHGLDFGPIVSGYAGQGNYIQDTNVGAPFGPTTVQSTFDTGTTATVVLGDTELSGSVTKEINSFGYFAFLTSFTVDEDMDVRISWDASTEVPWIDRRFRVWQSLGATLFEYDVNDGPHSGSITVSLTAGQQYWVDALYRSIWDNGDGNFSISTITDVCSADINGDGMLDFFDISEFLTAYGNGDSVADFNGDGNYDFFDISAFLTEYGAGCP